MSLEAATYISDLSASNPAAGDNVSQGDDHIRLLKAVMQANFPNATKAFRFPACVAEATGTVNVAFPDDNNKLFAVSANAASRTVNLPDASSGATVNEDGFTVYVVKTDSSANTVTIDGSGSQTINGATTLVLTQQWAFVKLVWSAADDDWYAKISNSVTTAMIEALAVTAAKLAADAVTTAKILDLNVTTGKINDLAVTTGKLAADAVTYAKVADGFVVDRAIDTYTSVAALSTVIPGDTSIPQIGEGVEILSISYTPKSTTNRLRVRFKAQGSLNGAGNGVAALFINGGADAVQADIHYYMGDNLMFPLSFEYEYVPGSVSAQTIAVRAGPTTAVSLRLNGTQVTSFFGGVMAAMLIVEEIKDT